MTKRELNLRARIDTLIDERATLRAENERLREDLREQKRLRQRAYEGKNALRVSRDSWKRKALARYRPPWRDRRAEAA